MEGSDAAWKISLFLGLPLLVYKSCQEYLQHLWQIHSWLGLNLQEPEGTAPNLNLVPTPAALKRRIVNYN